MEEDEIPVKKPRKPDKRKTQERTAFQGFRKPESAFFRLPNEWTDITADITSLAELKIIEYVARHTWGFQEFEKYITLTVDEFMLGRKRNDETRMDRGTGLSESAAKLGIASAIEHSYIECEVDTSDKGRISKSYRLKMVPSMDELEGQKVTPEGYNLTPEGQKVTARGVETNPRTDKIKGKDTNQRNLDEESVVPPHLQAFHSLYSKSRFFRGSKKMNTDKLAYYEELAPEIIALEQLESLYKLAEKRNYGNDKNIYLGNLVAALPEWKEQSQQPEEEGYEVSSTARLLSQWTGMIAERYAENRMTTRKRLLPYLDTMIEQKIDYDAVILAALEHCTDIEAFFVQVREAVPIEVEV